MNRKKERMKHIIDRYMKKKQFALSSETAQFNPMKNVVDLSAADCSFFLAEGNEQEAGSD